MKYEAEFAIVSIHSVAGTLLLGPETINLSTVVRELKQRLLNETPEAVGIALLQGECVLDDNLQLKELPTGTFNFTATFEQLQLSDEELVAIQAELQDAVKQRLNITQVFGEMSACAHANKDVVTMAVRGDREVIQVERDRDSNFVWTTPDPFRSPLEHAHKSLRSDEKLVLIAVRASGRALQYAAEELQADRDIVEEAVRQNGLALQFAHESLQADRAIVLEAVRRNGWALLYAHPYLKADKDVAVAAVQQRGSALKHVHPSLQEHQEVFEAVCRHDKLRKDWVQPPL